MEAQTPTSYKVLHVSVFKQNEVQKIINNVGASSLFTITQVGLDEFNNGNPSELSVYDVIIFGINDWGEVAQNRGRQIGRLSELEAYVKNGGGIVWTHDTLELWWDYGDLIEEPAGVNSVDISNTNQERVWYNSVEIVADHEILHYPYEIGNVGNVIEVPYTHTNGGRVKTATVIIKGHGASYEPKATDSNNFYLTVHEYGKGRVVIQEIGHSTIKEYNPSIFNMPSIQECRILVNSLYWAASPVTSEAINIAISPGAKLFVGAVSGILSEIVGRGIVGPMGLKLLPGIAKTAAGTFFWPIFASSLVSTVADLALQGSIKDYNTRFVISTAAGVVTTLTIMVAIASTAPVSLPYLAVVAIAWGVSTALSYFLGKLG
ncbi:MAG: hypothetical protein QW698_02005 [Nitrososphaerales archaeon]